MPGWTIASRWSTSICCNRFMYLEKSKMSAAFAVLVQRHAALVLRVSKSAPGVPFSEAAAEASAVEKLAVGRSR